MNDELKRERKLLEKISDVYVFFIILLFPLLIDSSTYFGILEFKWTIFFFISLVYIVINFIIILYFLLVKKINLIKNLKISKVQIFAFLFIVIIVLSSFISPYKNDYKLLLGEGRYEGLMINILYVLSFLNLSFFLKFKKIHISFFLIVSIFLSCIAIFQYFGLNPLNLYKNNHNISFMTTIGNVDTISAFYCILIPISFCSFICLNNSSNKFIYYISLLTSIMTVGIIDVQGGKLSLFLTCILILPIILLKSEYLSKFLIILSIILFDFTILDIFIPDYNSSLTNITYTYNFSLGAILSLIIAMVLIFLHFLLKKVKYDYTNDNRKQKFLYFILLIACLISIIFIYVFDINFSIFHELHEILHGNFDDTFGTYRIFLWKRSIKLVKDYPILGTGLDTFVIRFMNVYTDDLIKLGIPSINDTAANVYLTMLVNIGIIGLLTYLSFLYFLIKEGITKKNIYVKILLVSIICFLIQDFFNFSVVIVSPFYWALLAIYYSCLKDSY